MEQWDQATAATESALHSQGSAMRENEAYLESYEAKINQVKNAWTETAIALQEDVLGDAIVGGTTVATSFIQVLTQIVDKIGLLPVTLGIAGLAITGFNRNLRDTSSSLGRDTIKFLTELPKQINNTGKAAFSASAATDSFSTTIESLKKTAKSTGTVLGRMGSFMAGAILPIAGFMALGLAIDFVINKFVEARQRAEEWNKANEKSLESLANQEEQVVKLVDEYERLDKIGESNRNLAQEERYVELQNELGTLLPSVVQGEDEKGNKILANTEIVRDHISALEEQLAYEQEIARTGATTQIAVDQNEIEKAEKKLADLEKQLEKQQKRQAEFAAKGTKTGLEQAAVVGTWISSIRQDIQETHDEINGYQTSILDSFTVIAKAHSDALTNPDYTWIAQQGNDAEMSEQQVEQLTDRIVELRKQLNEDFTLDNLNFDQFLVVESISKSVSTGGSEWQKYIKTLKSVGIDSNQVSQILGHLRNSQEDIVKAAREHNASLDNSRPVFDDYGEIINFTTGEIDEFTDSLEENAEKIDELAEKYNDATSVIKDLNGILNDLNEGHGLSADSIELIMNKYDQFLPLLNDEIGLRKAIEEAVNKEADTAKQAILQKLQDNEDFYKNVTKANSDMVNQLNKDYGIDLSNFKSLAKAKLEVEETTIKTMAGAWSSYFKATGDGQIALSNEILNIDPSGAIDAGTVGFTQELLKKQKEMNSYLENVTSELDNIFLGGISSTFKNIGSDIDKTLNKNSKNYENSTYVSDKFKQALEKVNLELEKQNAIQSEFPKHSKEYQNSIKTEIDLNKQKLELLEQQREEMNQQISSGSIRQTGVVTTSSGGSSGYTGQYSNYINQAAQRYGVDPNLIAAIIKNESNFNPNATSRAGAQGLMQLMPATAKSLGVQDAYDPLENIMGGTKYIADQLKAFNGNLELALAAYNAGAGNVRKYGGLPPFPETQNYVPKVISSMEQYGSDSKTTSQLSQDIAKSQQDIDNAVSDVISIEQDIITTQNLINRLNTELVESNVAYYENLIAGVDRSISRVDKTLMQHKETSQEYRDALSDQIGHMEYKQRLMHQEAEYMREELKNDQLSAEMKADLTARISELSLAWWDVEEAIKDTNMAIINSRSSHFQDLIGGVDRSLEKINKQLQYYEEGSFAQVAALEEQIGHYEYKQSLLKQQEEYLRNQLKNTELTKDQMREIEIEISNIVLSWWDVENAITSVNDSLEQQNEQLADDLIDSMKAVYEHKKQMALMAIDEEIKAEDERHERQMQHYDDELEAYEKIIKAKLREIDKQADEESYEKELREMQEERLSLQKQIDLLALDDSFEAVAQRAELEEQLAEQIEEINEFQAERERKLRKDNLNEQLEDFKEEIDEKRDTENKKHKAESDRLKEIRKETEYHYNELLKNERKWSAIREDIRNGEIGRHKEFLNEFLSEFENMNESSLRKLQETFYEVGHSYQELLNLIDRVQDSGSNLDKARPPSSDSSNLPTSESAMIDRMKRNSEKWHSASESERLQLTKENEVLGKQLGATYDPATGVWSRNGRHLYHSDTVQEAIDTMKENSKKWHNASPAEQQRLRNYNQELGRAIGATYDPKTGLWFKDGLQLFHDGGIIGNKPTNRLTELANKLFNAKPNEQIVKSVKGELQIPPKNIPNIFKNIGNLINSSQQPVLAGGDTYEVNFYVDKMTGNETDVRKFGNKFMTEIKRKKGGKF